MLFTVLCLYPLGVEMAVFSLLPPPPPSYGVDCEVYGCDDMAVKFC